VFLELLRQYEQAGRNVSESKTANNYAPAAFAKEQKAKGLRRSGLEDAMRRLFEKRTSRTTDDRRAQRFD
jgi:hypothetical protein